MFPKKFTIFWSFATSSSLQSDGPNRTYRWEIYLRWEGSKCHSPWTFLMNKTEVERTLKSCPSMSRDWGAESKHGSKVTVVGWHVRTPGAHQSHSITLSPPVLDRGEKIQLLFRMFQSCWAARPVTSCCGLVSVGHSHLVQSHLLPLPIEELYLIQYS